MKVARILAVLLIPLLFAISAEGQEVLNNYGSYDWIIDSVSGYRTESIEFRVWEIANEFENTNVQLIEDSNTFSKISYGFAPSAIQYLRGSIFRPLNSRAYFSIYFDRVSSPGWMQRSRLHRTELRAQSGFNLSDRFSFEVDANFNSLTRQLNGGLIFREYSTNDFQGGNLSQINNNIILTGAESKRSDIGLESKFNYLINQNELNLNGLSLSLGFFKESFEFTDTSPDSSFYSSFDLTIPTGGARDSLQINAGLFGLEYKFQGKIFRIDSVIWINQVKEHFGLYEQNDYGFDFHNLDYSSTLDVIEKSFKIRTRYNVILLGNNEGAFSTNNSIEKTFLAIHRDSAMSRLSLIGSFNASATSPPILFTRYTSVLDTVRNSFSRVRSYSFEGGFKWSTRFGFALIKTNYLSKSNYTYFDDQGIAQQHKDAINMWTLESRINAEVEKWQWSALLLYRYNESKIYSVPEFSLNNDVAFKFNMFKKNLATAIGTEVTYYSRYYARGYLPWYDSFYSQETKLYGNYTQIDLFVSFTIRGVHAKFSFENLGYGILSNNPIVAPTYPSVPRFFMIDLLWEFRN